MIGQCRLQRLSEKSHSRKYPENIINGNIVQRIFKVLRCNYTEYFDVNNELISSDIKV